jgi:hypothetical protein
MYVSIYAQVLVHTDAQNVRDPFCYKLKGWE